MDLLIRNATLLDLDTGLESLADVAIQNGLIQDILPPNSPHLHADMVVEAHGRYLFPGFIDFHTHLFAHGSTFGLDADQLLSAGTTCAVDMGTAGWVNYPALHTCDLTGKQIQIRSFLNLSPVGQPGKGINEPLDDTVINPEQMRRMLAQYPGEIVGIKVRISRSIVRELGIEPLRRAVQVGEELGLPVCVHTTDPPVSAGEITAILRPGDIYSHMYHSKGNTILDPDGAVQAQVRADQNRGVLMEVGNGRVNFNFPVAEQAAACGFWPDIISSDATPATFHKEAAMWDLPMVMSKFLCLGMPLTDVIRAVTQTPAHLLGLTEQMGSIRAGLRADLVLCRIEQGEITFCDSDGNRRVGNRRILPELTFLGGRQVS